MMSVLKISKIDLLPNNLRINMVKVILQKILKIFNKYEK